MKFGDCPHTFIMKYASDRLWLFFHSVIIREFVKLKTYISGRLLGKPSAAEEKSNTSPVMISGSLST